MYTTIFPKTFNPLSQNANFAKYVQLLYSTIRVSVNGVVDQKLSVLLFYEIIPFPCVTFVSEKK